MPAVIAWIQLVAAIALLGVTYWYAKTTKSMADAANQAATESARATAAAERSAEAARDAATVAQSQIKPEFTGRQIFLMGDEHTSCIRITSVGDAVVIQEVRIRRAFRQSYDSSNPESEAWVAELTLVAATEESSLPRRLHRDELLLLTHPDIQDVRDDPFNRFIIDIDYTFSEGGSAGATRTLIFDH